VAAEILVASKLPAFAAAYPDIHVELTVESELSDIVGSGYDAGVRPGGLLHQDMIAVRLTPDLRIAIVGSPAYFECNPMPRMPKDLAEHACIHPPSSYISRRNSLAEPVADETVVHGVKPTVCD
jgi:DNA-binding transcriptional LysR family regulator